MPRIWQGRQVTKDPGNWLGEKVKRKIDNKKKSKGGTVIGSSAGIDPDDIKPKRRKDDNGKGNKDR